MPFSYCWSNTIGAFNTHWPAAMHLCGSIETFMVNPSYRSPGERKLVHSVDEHVVAKAQFLERHRKP